MVMGACLQEGVRMLAAFARLPQRWPAFNSPLFMG